MLHSPGLSSYVIKHSQLIKQLINSSITFNKLYLEKPSLIFQIAAKHWSLRKQILTNLKQIPSHQKTNEASINNELHNPSKNRINYLPNLLKTIYKNPRFARSRCCAELFNKNPDLLINVMNTAIQNNELSKLIKRITKLFRSLDDTLVINIFDLLKNKNFDLYNQMTHRCSCLSRFNIRYIRVSKVVLDHILTPTTTPRSDSAEQEKNKRMLEEIIQESTRWENSIRILKRELEEGSKSTQNKLRELDSDRTLTSHNRLKRSASSFPQAARTQRATSATSRLVRSNSCPSLLFSNSQIKLNAADALSVHSNSTNSS